MGRHGADTVAMSGALSDARETKPGSRSVGPGCPCSLALRPVTLALFGLARNKQFSGSTSVVEKSMDLIYEEGGNAPMPSPELAP